MVDKTLERRDVTGRLLSCKSGDETGERFLLDRAAQTPHQIAIVAEIVLGQQHASEDLVGADEMMEISAAVMCARGAAAAFIERPRILAMARVAQIDLAAARERLAGAAGARRQ